MRKSDPEDHFVWPDGTTCTREDYERGEYSHMSDDFVIVPFNEITTGE